ncbi:MAG: endolytic transglycosylase MltG [Myxococcota bacterium]
MSRRRPRRRTRSRGRWRLRATLLALLAAAGGGLWLWWALTSHPEGNPEDVDLQVPHGTTGRGIVRLLAEEGLAPHPVVTYWALRTSGALDDVEAGIHVIPGDASVVELAELMRRPADVHHVVLTLVPGESVWQAAERLDATGLGRVEDLLRLASRRDLAAELGLPVGPPRDARNDEVPATWLEGFLYPDTYFFAPEADAEDVVRRVTARFREVWEDLTTRRASDRMAIAQRYGLDDHDLVTLASLVEEETRVPEEAATIAGVFYNRLARGMKLQTDPTLMYHPARVGRAPTPAERRDDSNPYNTYAHEGLPPGPICSPGRVALEATLAPERHDYLYFVARRRGRGAHVFSRTLPEHRAHIRRYLGGGD